MPSPWQQVLLMWCCASSCHTGCWLQDLSEAREVTEYTVPWTFRAVHCQPPAPRQDQAFAFAAERSDPVHWDLEGVLPIKLLAFPWPIFSQEGIFWAKLQAISLKGLGAMASKWHGKIDSQHTCRQWFICPWCRINWARRIKDWVCQHQRPGLTTREIWICCLQRGGMCWSCNLRSNCQQIFVN